MMPAASMSSQRTYSSIEYRATVSVPPPRLLPARSDLPVALDEPVDLLVVRDEEGVGRLPMKFVDLHPEVGAPDLRSIRRIEEVQHSIVAADENARFGRKDEVHFLPEPLLPHDLSGVESDCRDVSLIAASVRVIPLDELDGGAGGKSGEEEGNRQAETAQHGTTPFEAQAASLSLLAPELPPSASIPGPRPNRLLRRGGRTALRAGAIARGERLLLRSETDP